MPRRNTVRGRKYSNRVTLDGGRVVRFAVEWDRDVLQRQVQRAFSQQGGRAAFGPIVVYVHPEDRAPAVNQSTPDVSAERQS